LPILTIDQADGYLTGLGTAFRVDPFGTFTTPDRALREHIESAEAREAAAAFLEDLIANVPQPRWEVVRTVAEGDLVFLAWPVHPAAGAPPCAIPDVFRLEGKKL
jgi:predicted SnoaL-like aldol condensation-catalyzing enzyme